MKKNYIAPKTSTVVCDYAELICTSLDIFSDVFADADGEVYAPIRLDETESDDVELW